MKHLNKPEPAMPHHEPPHYYGYYRYTLGGFSSTTECKKCKAVGLYEDCHPARPCKFCGGSVQSAGPSIWIPPTFRGLWPFRRLVKAGYWKKPDA